MPPPYGPAGPAAWPGTSPPPYYPYPPAAPPPKRVLEIRHPSWPFLVVGFGFLLLFIGAVVAIAGSGPQSTVVSAANALLTGRILASVGFLAVGGGAGLDLLMQPALTEEAGPAARLRYLVHHTVVAALVIVSLILLLGLL
ncbi:MAG: hypothetical protein QXG65_00855 [Thermoplasmata archaeon]